MNESYENEHPPICESSSQASHTLLEAAFAQPVGKRNAATCASPIVNMETRTVTCPDAGITIVYQTVFGVPRKPHPSVDISPMPLLQVLSPSTGTPSVRAIALHGRSFG